MGIRGEYFEFVNNSDKALFHASTLRETDDEVERIRDKKLKSSLLPASSEEECDRKAGIRKNHAADWEKILAETGVREKGVEQ